MKKFFSLFIAILICYSLVYALTYIESSQGLENPGMEGGRTELEMVDINNDGNIDILSIGDHGSPYVNTQEHGVMVWFGNGQGVWNLYQYGDFGYGGIAIGDVNNDGLLDIGYGMHHNYSNNDLGDSIIEVALGNGTGQTWTAWDDGISIGDPNSWGMFCTDFADIDNDGDLDLAFCNSNGGIEVWVWQGNNNWASFSTGLPTTGPYEITQLCDMNIDGFMDVCAYGDTTVTVWLGNGAGVWTHNTTFYTPGPGGMSAFRVSADADHNGYPDIALVNDEGDSWNSANRPRFYKESSVPESLFIFPVFPRGRQKFYRGSVQFIKWTCGVPSGNATIKLELSTTGAGGPWTTIASNLKNNCRYQWHIPSGIQGSENCYIRFTATTTTDTAIAITPEPFTILPIVGIKQAVNEPIKNSSLIIYPNPSDRVVYIKACTKQGSAFIRIYDTNGKLIRNLFKVNGAGEFNIYWDRKNNFNEIVPAGVYFIRLEDSEGVCERKIVIMSY